MPFYNFFTKHIYEMMESANGRHRTAGAPGSGDPRACAGGLAGTTGAAVANARACECAIAIARERARIDALKAQQAAAAAASSGAGISSAPGSVFWFTTIASAMLPSPGQLSKHIPNTGLTVGEIIAHRVWRIDSYRRLRSAHMPNLWLPGEPMVGDVSEHGVYAFKDLPQDVGAAALAYSQSVMSNGGGRLRAMAIGRVKLWGAVVEHERGYRAEFAIPHAIDRVAVMDGLSTYPANYGCDDSRGTALLDQLRAIYGVTP